MSDLAASIASKVSSLNGTTSMGTNVQVAVRCRPSNSEEKKTNQPTVITCDAENKSLKVSFGPAGKKISKNYTFDKVFGMYSTQEEVFESIVRPIVDEALAGFNCTIFAYGQTGTGKTHTMEGNIHSEEHAGIVPRSVKAILEQLEASDSEYTIRVSFLELYNEELQDLLNTSGDRKLKLCEDIKKGVVCQNLEEITVLNVGDIFEILQRGIQQRQTAETLMNKNSSRSHSIFTMKIMIKECNVDGEEVVRHGQLNLVDLAGSECIGRSGAKNDRAREAGSINQSLLTLGRVITALVDHHGHIPYRDSKLTRLLQESLGGKAKTVIIATLSPSQLAVEETMSTLDYAHRAKNIKNQPTVNQRMTKKVVLKEYCAEIEMLKSQLQITREKNGVYVNPEDYYAMEARIQTQEGQITECEGALKCRNEELKTLRVENVDLTEKCEILTVSLQTSQEEADQLREQLAATQVELASTKAEWAAAEAVVREQSTTETALFSQGQGLQGEVEGRRSDVTKLLEKVNRFSDSEAQRVQSAAGLVGDIGANTEQMQEGIRKMTEASKAQSSLLCQGVSEMLARGKNTCVTLKASIDTALTTLIGDASAARDSMTTSCDQLEGHLGDTNTHVAVTLKGLQSELSLWLGEVDLSMQEARQLLTQQNTQLDAFSAALTAQAVEYTDMNSQFISKLDKDFESALQNSGVFGEELEAMFLALSEKVLEEVKTTKEQMSSKASAIEEAMKGMLKDLMSSTADSLALTSSSVSAFSKKAKKASKAGLGEINKSFSAAQTNSRKHTAAAATKVQAYGVSQKQNMVSIEESRAGTLTVLDGISGDVGNKRNTLDVTVSSLVSDVDQAMKKARTAVSDTSDSANAILKDVVSATEAMTSSSNTALTSFEDFMDQEGEEIQQTLGVHFETLEGHFCEQTGYAVSVAGSSSTYGVAAQEVLGSTGSTPGKTLFRPLGGLVRTRDHVEIRAENKRAVDALEGTAEVQGEELVSVPIETPILSETAVKAAESEEPSRMSVSTIASSDSDNSNDDSENSENAHPNKIPSLNSSTSLQKSIPSKMTRIGGRGKGAKQVL